MLWVTPDTTFPIPRRSDLFVILSSSSNLSSLSRKLLQALKALMPFWGKAMCEAFPLKVQLKTIPDTFT